MVIKLQKIDERPDFSLQINHKPEYARLLRIAEREMKDAFRLTDLSHPMMRELRDLCVARRLRVLIKNQGGSSE